MAMSYFPQTTDDTSFSKMPCQGGWKRTLVQLAVMFIAVDLLVLAVICSQSGWPAWPAHWRSSTNLHWVYGTKLSIQQLNTKGVRLLERLVNYTKPQQEINVNHAKSNIEYAENLFYEITTNLSTSHRNPHPHPSENHMKLTLGQGYGYFKPRMTVAEMKSLLDLLKIFHRVSRDEGLFYMMCGGTLLGSYRFHGMIPWDDDADVYSLYSERLQLKQALEKLAPTFTLFSHYPSGKSRKAQPLSIRWKLYSLVGGKDIKGIAWKFPFLDISFLRQNSTHLWDNDRSFKKTFMFKKSQIYPLGERPYMGVYLNAPNDTKSVLQKSYQLAECNTNTYNHKQEHLVAEPKRKSVPCTKLQSIYPFVSHSKKGKSFNETLIYKDQIIYSILL